MQPYQPTSTVLQRAPQDAPKLSWGWLAIYLYPLIFTAWMFLTWLMAAWHLGRWPRPNVDDPNSIGLAVSGCYFVHFLMLMLLVPMLPLGLVASFKLLRWQQQPTSASLSQRLMPTGLFLLMCYLLYQLQRWDPLQIIAWLAD